jgi:hypothetical protein
MIVSPAILQLNDEGRYVDFPQLTGYALPEIAKKVIWFFEHITEQAMCSL